MNNDEELTNVVGQDDAVSNVKDAKPKGKARASAKHQKANAMREAPKIGNRTEEVNEAQPPETVAPPQEVNNRVRYCSSCGTPYLSEARFCTNCGRNVYNDEIQLQTVAQNNAIPPLIPHVPLQSNAAPPVNPYVAPQYGVGQYQPQCGNAVPNKPKNSLVGIFEKIKAFPYLMNVFVAALSIILLFTALFAPFKIKDIQVHYYENSGNYGTQIKAESTINQSIYDMFGALSYIDRDMEFYDEVSARNQKITERMLNEIDRVTTGLETPQEWTAIASRIQTKYMSQMNYYGSLITAAILQTDQTVLDSELALAYAIGSSVAGAIAAALMIALAIASLITLILDIVGIIKKKKYNNQPRIFKAAIGIGLGGVIAMSFMTKVALTSCAFSVLLIALLFYAAYAFANQIVFRKAKVAALTKNACTFVYLFVSLCLLCGVTAGISYNNSGDSILFLGSASLFFECVLQFLNSAGNLPTAPEIVLISYSAVMLLLSILSILLTVIAMTETITAAKYGKTSGVADVLAAVSAVFMLALIILLSTVSAEFVATGEIWSYRLTGVFIAAFVFNVVSVIASIVLRLVARKKPLVNQPEEAQPQA